MKLEETVKREVFYLKSMVLVHPRSRAFSSKPHNHLFPKSRLKCNGGILNKFYTLSISFNLFACISGLCWMLRYPGQSCFYPAILLINSVFLCVMACCVIRIMWINRNIGEYWTHEASHSQPPTERTIRTAIPGHEPEGTLWLLLY